MLRNMVGPATSPTYRCAPRWVATEARCTAPRVAGERWGSRGIRREVVPTARPAWARSDRPTTLPTRAFTRAMLCRATIQ